MDCTVGNGAWGVLQAASKDTASMVTSGAGGFMIGARLSGLAYFIFDGSLTVPLAIMKAPLPCFP